MCWALGREDSITNLVELRVQLTRQLESQVCHWEKDRGVYDNK